MASFFLVFYLLLLALLVCVSILREKENDSATQRGRHDRGNTFVIGSLFDWLFMANTNGFAFRNGIESISGASTSTVSEWLATACIPIVIIFGLPLVAFARLGSFTAHVLLNGMFH